MTQDEINFIVRTADRFAKEIWNTEHLSCVGNLSVKLQELVKNLTMHDATSESGKKQTILELEEVTVRGNDAYTEQDNERTAVCDVCGSVDII